MSPCLPSSAAGSQNARLGYWVLTTFSFRTCSGAVGYVLTVVTIAWCAYSASSIFTSVLRMQSQRLLVAYPVAMVYACFRLSLG